jgi:hypothetical protein
VPAFRRCLEMFGKGGSSWHRCNALSIIAERIEQKMRARRESPLRWIENVGAVVLGAAVDNSTSRTSQLHIHSQEQRWVEGVRWLEGGSWASFHLNVVFDELDDQSENPCLESVPAVFDAVQHRSGVMRLCTPHCRVCREK